MNHHKARAFSPAAGAACIFALTFCVYLLTVAPTLSWRNGGVDGGDLVTAAVNLSVPHPPGYPVYMVAAQVFLGLPVGEPAFRLNLMSAFFGSAAASIFYLLCTGSQTGSDSWPQSLGAAVATLVLAFSTMVWSQATIVEVHTLHLFLMAAFFAMLFRLRRYGSRRIAFLAGLMLGLGLGNHMTFIFAVLAALLLFVSSTQTGLRDHSLQAAGDSLRFGTHVVVTLGCMAGLSAYMYIPIATHLGSPSNWGPLDSLPGVIDHVAGTLYQPFVFNLPAGRIPERLLSVVAMMINDFQVWGMMLAALGVAHCARHDRSAAASALVLGAGTTVFALGYNSTDSYRYLLPLWFVTAFFAAAGLATLLSAVASRRRALVVIGVSSVVIWPLIAGLMHYPAMDASRDREAEKFAYSTLAALPPEAILVSRTDRHTFSLWYFHQVRGIRPDVVIIDGDLLAHAPYRQVLSARWPRLALSDDDVESFISLNGFSRQVFAVAPDGKVERMSGVRARAYSD